MLTFDELWELLITEDEGVEIEAKKGSEVGKSCWETISAFSNEPSLGGGYLLLGIKSPEESDTNNYEIEGIAYPDKIQLDLATQCREVFNITIRPQIETATKDGKIVIVAFINLTPVTISDAYEITDCWNNRVKDQPLATPLTLSFNQKNS
ncbi:MAG: putative DNA binding domain-containing protein [Scytonema sp. PMC 1069.18]|nr:putative DNA binding domain-containing protein [Scytonema sp. PMC 1069.18]MEC4886610.1 putative DNA binding domain-containing protein [Scytonema sp. PMC 1070.18]